MNPNPTSTPRFETSGHPNGERARGGRGSVKLRRELHLRLVKWSLATGTPLVDLANKAIESMLAREQRRVLREQHLPWG